MSSAGLINFSIFPEPCSTIYVLWRNKKNVSTVIPPAFVPKDIAIKVNLPLYRKLNEQIDM